jgi:uncharacterized membrane protein
MNGYRASMLIAAPMDVVWNVLTDVDRMPEWTPTMRFVRVLDGGQLGVGSRVGITQPRLPPATWTVDRFDPPRYFSWRSRTGAVQTVAGHLLEEQGPATLAELTIEHSAITGRSGGPRHGQAHVGVGVDGRAGH